MSAAAFLADNEARLIGLRRDIHAHPELGREEYRTTGLVADTLSAAGLSPRLLPEGTGLLCDIGPQPPEVALRADLDALPIPDAKEVSYRSTVDGVTHACGHDVHTTVVLGAGLALAGSAARGELGHGVRLVFQPAEEVIPGGALDVIRAGGLDGIRRLYAVHCDPSIEVGTVGLRTGAVTAASDLLEVRLSGPGGHTARPHLSADLVGALGAVITATPGLLARRADPRSGTTLVWGQVSAGTVANAIPRHGVVRGTLRTLSRETWDALPPLVDRVVRDVVAPYGVGIEISHVRGVPPVVNDPDCVEVLAAAATSTPGGLVGETAQSLGGEDFGWYLDQVPGALARLGVRAPASPVLYDLHQSSFDVDERCIGIGVSLLTGVALTGSPPVSSD
ncbi:MAG TPA: amidohydrolase [Mycobacteriales bacterium]|nr:amidohydrolase [Mycobacteriales bacterium]